MILAWLAIGLAAGWVAFAYVGYPLALWLVRLRSPRPVARTHHSPPLSVIVAVHNGEGELAAKLEDTLAQEYSSPVEVIVASDGSTDRTETIAGSFAGRGVVLVRNPERRGKEAAQSVAIPGARGDVLVFTDVGARLEPGALRAIVRPFADPSVGAVSSEDVVDTEQGEGAYVRYEMALRRLESEASTLIGLSGSFFAVRRELADPWPPDLASDFRCALECGRRGLRAVSEPSARARFRVLDDPRAEWARKVRTVRRGIAVLAAYRALLHPRHGRVALTLWGHKVARFTSPFALIVLLVASLAAAPSSPLAAVLLGGQVVFYATGALALVARPLQGALVARLAAFFLLVNASILTAWVHHLRGQRAVTWQPTTR